jgi:5-methylthioadenosine/S-adenosylhomocysteine deaminase
LDEKTLLVHAVHSDENDIKIISDRHSAIAHNPESNMKLASGIAPLYCFSESGIRLGLGTDGAASNNTMDMFRTMDIAAKLHKVRTSDPTTADAHTVLRLATIDAAKAIGLDKEIGSLEIGKKADMMIVECRVPHLTPMYHPVSHLVYSADSGDVRDVWIDGKIIVKNRNLITINLETVFQNIEVIAKSVSDGNSCSVTKKIL